MGERSLPRTGVASHVSLPHSLPWGGGGRCTTKMCASHASAKSRLKDEDVLFASLGTPLKQRVIQGYGGGLPYYHGSASLWTSSSEDVLQGQSVTGTTELAAAHDLSSGAVKPEQLGITWLSRPRRPLTIVDPVLLDRTCQIRKTLQLGSQGSFRNVR